MAYLTRSGRILIIEYVRDKRSPTPKSEAVSRVMSANRAKNTSPELTLRRALWQLRFRGYRLHPKNVPGRPDIAYTTRKLAIFVNGCFWHRCPKCAYKLPKTNRKFWKQKFDRNIERDARKQKDLLRSGWKVILVWECDLKASPARVLSRIKKVLS